MFYALSPFLVAPLTYFHRRLGVCRPSDEEVALSRMLDKVLRRSDAVDKEGLCILAGQRVRFYIFDGI